MINDVVQAMIYRCIKVLAPGPWQRTPGSTRGGVTPPANATSPAQAGGRSWKSDPERLTQLRHLIADDISLDRVWRELNSPRRLDAPQATVDALTYELRTHAGERLLPT